MDALKEGMRMLTGPSCTGTLVAKVPIRILDVRRRLTLRGWQWEVLVQVEDGKPRSPEWIHRGDVIIVDLDIYVS